MLLVPSNFFNKEINYLSDDYILRSNNLATNVKTQKFEKSLIKKYGGI